MANFLSDFVKLIRSRLFYKMLIIYSLLTLIPLIVVSTTFYYRTSHLIGKKATEEVQKELGSVATAIDAPLLDIKKRMLEVSEQEPIQSYLKLYQQTGSNSTNDGNRFNLLERVKDVLQVERDELKRTVGPFVDSMYLITPDDLVVGIDGSRALRYPSAYRLMPFQFERMPEWAFFTDDRRMVCAMKIFGVGEVPDTDVLLGQLIVTLHPSELQNAYADFAPGTFYITNSDNIVLSASDSNEIGSVLDVRGPVTQLQIRQKSQMADFRYIRLATPGADKIVVKQALFSAMLTLLAWLGVLVVTYLILKRVTDPIQRLTRLMRRAEKQEYQLIKEVATKDEIAMLCHGYNQLVLRTKDLIDKNYKNELLVREAELRAIRMYINPHFLYNTLEYISIMSQIPAKARYVPDIVQKLSSIFRFSILPGEKFVSLETEFAFAEKYLQIHQYRFGGRMHFSIVLPDMLRQVAVPKLALQPLVENAVIHGIGRLPDGGSIEIEAKEEDYMLVVEIRNPAPRAESDCSSDSDRLGKNGLGSGLENVNMRIRHHFGNAYGAKLSRDADGKVTVKIQMPIQLWNETGED